MFVPVRYCCAVLWGVVVVVDSAISESFNLLDC